MALLLDGIANVLQMLIFSIYMKEVIGIKRSTYYTFFYWLGIEVVNQCIRYFFDLELVNTAAYFILLLIIANVMCTGCWKKKMFFSIAYVVLDDIIKVIVTSLFVTLSGFDLVSLVSNSIFSSLLLIYSQILLFIIVQLLRTILKRRVLKQSILVNWLMLFLVPLGCFVIIKILTFDMIFYNIFSLSKIFVFSILVVLIFIGYYFYFISNERNCMAQKAMLYQKQIIMYQDWYDSIYQVSNEIHSFQHDMNNHFSVLKKLCQSGLEKNIESECLEEIERYIDRFWINYQRSFTNINSGNLIIDSILNAKKDIAISKKIDMSVNLTIPQKMNMNGVDMVILLGNLLDNAIEACEKVVDNEKKISVIISYYIKNLLISVSNTYDGILDGKSSDFFKILPTNKANNGPHGIGMQNIKSIVDKHNGVLEWKADKGVFKLEIYLYSFENRKIEI